MDGGLETRRHADGVVVVKRRGFLRALAGLPMARVIPAAAPEATTEVERKAAAVLAAVYDEAAEKTYEAAYRHVMYGYAMVLEHDVLKGDIVRFKSVGCVARAGYG